MKNKIKLSLITTALLIGSLSFPAVSFADNQEPILIEISDTDIGTEAFEQLISHGNGGHAAIGAILGNAQSMSSNPGIGFSIGSGGNGYRPSIIIAVWTDQPFNVSTGLDTIKSHFNVPLNPVTTNGDCAIACDGTTQVEEVVTTTTIAPTTTIAVTPITTTTTVAPTTTLPEVVAPTQVSQSPQTTQPEPVQSQPQPIVHNTEPYTAPTTTTTTVVETVNVSSAFVAPVLTEKLISSISKPKVIKPKVIKSNKAKKVLTKIK
jgi:hypothetical protein